jgi:hypothetical protein
MEPTTMLLMLTAFVGFACLTVAAFVLAGRGVCWVLDWLDRRAGAPDAPVVDGGGLALMDWLDPWVRRN